MSEVGWFISGIIFGVGAVWVIRIMMSPPKQKKPTMTHDEYLKKYYPNGLNAQGKPYVERPEPPDAQDVIKG